jgi:O-antigen/teichoic acid export membrane protein
MNARLEVPMSAAAVQGLGRRALSLGTANAIDYALQFLLPVVLVRCLEPEAFGQYRLLWLAAATAMALVTQAMPGSLYYFLPRLEAMSKRLYINQTLVFLALAGMLAAWAFSAWNPWLPERMRDLAQYEVIVPAFILLWVIASMLDLLPTIEERIAWQAKATIGLSALRTMAVSLTAFMSGDLESVLLVLLGFVAFKVALLLVYVARFHGLRGPILQVREFRGQLKYAAPFGAAGALYALRIQADQWVAATLFSVGMFAAFSIATVLAPLVHLFRVSVIYAFLPGMSRLQASGDVPGMLKLNNRANTLVGALVYPLLAFAFVFSEEIVTVIYTASYLDAAHVMRVYIVGLTALTVELASIMLLLQQGTFTMRLGLVALIIAIVLSWFSAHIFGLVGAAVGSVTAIYLDLVVTLRRIALRTGIPVRRLQDWRALGLSMLFAALAAAFAWGVVGHNFGAGGPLVRLAAGAALLGGTYALLQALFGPGRLWLAGIRSSGRGL